MAEKDDIFKQLGHLKENRQFRVPDGYFGTVTDKIMTKVEESEKPATKPSFIRLIRPQLAVAASFAALFLLAYTVINIIIPEEEESLAKNEIIAALEHEVYDLDEEYLFDLVYSPQTENATINLSEEEIIQYLIDEGYEPDFTNTDL